MVSILIGKWRLCYAVLIGGDLLFHRFCVESVISMALRTPSRNNNHDQE
jgi:hypothetical protein